MTSPLSLAMSKVCESLSLHTGLHVSLGNPNDAVPNGSIVLWPWRFDDSAQLKSIAPDLVPTRCFDVHFMLIGKPTATTETLDELFVLQQAIVAHAQVNVDNQFVQLALHTLSTDELTQLFLAAQTPLRIAICARAFIQIK
jgi:hypothetical protein